MSTQDEQSSTSFVETKEHIQTNLWGEPEENPSYLSEQLITYIGNKRLWRCGAHFQAPCVISGEH